MTDWGAAERDYLAELGRREPARRPASFSEIASANFSAAMLHTPVLSALPQMNALDGYRSAVEQATGQNLWDMARAAGLPFAGTLSMDQIAEILDRTVEGLDDDRRKELTPLADWRGIAAAEAQQTEATAAEVQERTYGIAGNALAVASGLAVGLVDPVYLASAPIGGPFKGPILKMMLREGLAIGGVQALAEPMIQSRRAAYGLDHGIEQAATNIGVAFAGGAALSLVFRGAGAAWRKVSGKTARPSPLDADDFDALATFAERNEVLDAQAVPPTPRGRVQSVERIDSAAAAMERGRVPDPSPQPSPLVSADIYGPSLASLSPDGSPPLARPDPTLTFQPQRVAFFDGDRQLLIRPGGQRLSVRPAVMELADLTVSHALDGQANPHYPAALQPRDRSGAASRSFVAERAAELEPELLGLSPTAAEGAPVIGPDGIVESGNGRAMMIARAYDRHPERAAAYRAHLEKMGYSLDGFDHPVLVRIREGELSPPSRSADASSPLGDRASFAREANVSPVAGLSVTERASADATRLDDHLMALWQGGETTSLGNVKFARAFADRAVAPEERPNFIDASNRLSADGRTRIEAALVARAWGEKDIVAALYEAGDPTSKSILGALADTAPLAARVKTAIAEGRIAAADDPAPAIVDAFRLVDRARNTGVKVRALADQIDIETGETPAAVKAFVRHFFHDDDLSIAAGRDAIAERLSNALNRAIDKQNAIGDLFAARAGVADNAQAANLAARSLDDLPLAEAPRLADDPPAGEHPLDTIRRRLDEGTQTREEQLVADEAYESLADGAMDQHGVQSAANAAVRNIEDLIGQGETHAPNGAPWSDVIAKIRSLQDDPSALPLRAEAPVGRALPPPRRVAPETEPVTATRTPEEAAVKAEADRVLEDMGGDFEIFLPGEVAGGDFVRVSARSVIAEAEEDAAAAAELAACIAGQAAGGAA